MRFRYLTKWVTEPTFLINDVRLSVKLPSFRRLSAIFDLKVDQISEIELHLENCSQLQLLADTTNCHENYFAIACMLYFL